MVKSRKVIKKIAVSSIKSKTNKYSLIALAVVLTSTLFSSLFTVVESLMYEFRQSSMDQYSAYIDPTALIVGLALILIFMLSGYLIIHNIFDLNVITDIQEYGLLKTIGTSKKQIKNIVKERAKIISKFAIPIGLIIGVGVGGWLLSLISPHINTFCENKGSIHFNILIILFTAVFSYITVLISSKRPCKKASKVSPVEALRYSGMSDKKIKKKYLTVIISLTLSLVIFNSVYTMMNSFTPNGLVNEFVVSDFCVQDYLLDNAGTDYKNTEGVDEKFLDEVKKQDGVERIGNIYVNDESCKFGQETWNKVKSGFLSDEIVQDAIKECCYDDEYGVNEYLSDTESTRSIVGHTYGMGELAVEQLKDVVTIDGTKSIDWEKFNSGDYVISERWQYANDGFVDVVNPGDKVSLSSAGSDVSKEYTVYAVADIPIVVEYPVYDSIESNIILPEEEYLSLNGECAPMRSLIEVEDVKEMQFEEWLENYTKASNSTLSYSSKRSVVEDNKSFGELFVKAGAVIGIVFFVIGIMNFANTMIASIVARSKEFAIYEAVGMTGRQLRYRLIKDGMGYFAGASVLSCMLSTILNVTLIKTFVNNFPMFKWNFSLTAIAICLPVIFVLVIVIPIAAYKKISKNSIVDRLRTE